jgi:hypothetical protein
MIKQDLGKNIIGSIPVQEIQFSQRIDIVIQAIVEKPFSILNDRLHAVFACFGAVSPTQWSFAIDPETGLQVLQVKEDSYALEKIRKMADSLLSES